MIKAVSSGCFEEIIENKNFPKNQLCHKFHFDIIL